MQTTNVLMREHQLIDQVLHCLDRICERCATEGRLGAAEARDALNFLRGFATGCHREKEDWCLFILSQRGAFSRDGGPLSTLNSERTQLDAHLRTMRAAIEEASQGVPDAMQQFVEHSCRFAVLQREHLQREEDHIFPLIDNFMSAGEQRALLIALEGVLGSEITAIGQYYRGVADRLAAVLHLNDADCEMIELPGAPVGLM